MHCESARCDKDDSSGVYERQIVLMIEERSKKFNWGISLIKIWACFCVVSLHFGGGGVGRRLAVPIFAFLSLYLSGNKLVSGVYRDFQGRALSLYVPFAFWGCMGLVYAFICGKSVGVADILWQFVTGYGVPGQGHLYYIIIVILAMAIIGVTVAVGKEWWLCLFVVLCFVLQYTGVNFKVFNVFHPNSKWLVGRIAELLPSAIAGYMFYRYRSRLGIKKWLVTAVTIFLASAILYVVELLPQPQGFGYQGLFPCMMACSLCVGIIIAGERFDCIPVVVQRGIVGVGSLTNGVYYSHGVIGGLLKEVLGVGGNNFAALMIYIVCGIFSRLIMQHGRMRWIFTGFKIR